MADDERYQTERRRVTRCWEPISPERDEARRALRHRGRRDETFYVHPDVPNRAYPTRGDAARAGMRTVTRVDLDEPRRPLCEQPGCVDPYGDRYGHHYHCGRCSSPDVTGMYGHLSNGRWRCPVPAALDAATDTEET